MNPHVKAISYGEAGKVMSETYELFGRSNFQPSREDVKIWMKLCDRNKD